MTNPTIEFSREINFHDLSSKEKRIAIMAEAGERKALEGRIGIPSLTKLEATVMLLNEGRSKGVSMIGKLSAEGDQACIASLKPVAFTMQENLNIRFLAEDLITPELEEENLYTPESEDLEPYPAEGLLDLGELVTQYFALFLDPYPRAEGAELSTEQMKDISINEPLIEKPNPFAELAKLRDKT